jgi:hypothetical protein
VIPGLKEVDPPFSHQVDNPMLLSESPGPDRGIEVLQPFRFSDPVNWIAQVGLDQPQNALCRPTIGPDPVLQVLPKL